jgi:hypothetical protein
LYRCAAAAWQGTLLLRGAAGLIASDSLRSDLRQGRMLLLVLVGHCVTFMFTARRHRLCVQGYSKRWLDWQQHGCAQQM